MGGKLPFGQDTAKLHALVRRKVPFLDNSRVLAGDVRTVNAIISGPLILMSANLNLAQKAIGDYL